MDESAAASGEPAQARAKHGGIHTAPMGPGATPAVPRRGLLDPGLVLAELSRRRAPTGTGAAQLRAGRREIALDGRV